MSSDYVEARVALQRRARRRRPWLDAAQTPFRDDAPMVGPPRTTAVDFEMPRLRPCHFNLDSMVWETRVDGGVDGYVEKVRFGAQRPFVLKVAAVASRPILVNAKPITWDDATSPADHGLVPPPGLRQISTMPRMKRCYGWLTILGNVFQELHWSLRPPPVQVDRIKRYLALDQEYIAIVYECVEEGENDPGTMQKVMDFFWLAGFSRTFSPLLGNWKSGVLMDLSDIVPPRGYGWQTGSHCDQGFSRQAEER
ncbi:hypothetical protein B0J18DRAFT_452162 [Chaetomium sp. MPI-SDFR-AT-0129]|nr:hypothetical protein B0J18DRAFT_452162 [Chaetomium sp. MPI-SDFR-AT-0129]